MNKKDAIILLSGGIDCTSALACTVEKYNYICSITFDYGQKAFQKEEKAAKQISEFYNINQKTIKLNWLENITQSALVAKMQIPENVNINDLNQSKNSANAVWVPNRNSVFINIAAAFLDSKNGGVVVIGANKEEAKTFSDNSKEFISSVNKLLEYSCQKEITVDAPLIDFDKVQIVKSAVEKKVPFEFINSCYADKEGHCGSCESCLRLKNALLKNGLYDLAGKLFNQ